MSGPIEEGWNVATSPPMVDFGDSVEEIRQLLESISLSDTDDWDEIVIEEGGDQAVIRRTASKDYLVQLSIIPNEYEEFTRSGGPHDITPEDVIKAMDQIEGPATTAEEVAEKLHCSAGLVKRYLDELFAMGRVASRESGSSTLWWNTGEAQDLLRGFGEFSNTEIPDLMREERARLRDEWNDDEVLSR